MRSKDVPGNSMETAAAIQRVAARQGAKLLRWESLLESLDNDDTILSGLKVRLPQMEYDEYLIVVQAAKDGERVVAFQSAPTLAEAFEGLFNRLENRSIRWRADEYA